MRFIFSNSNLGTIWVNRITWYKIKNVVWLSIIAVPPLKSTNVGNNSSIELIKNMYSSVQLTSATKAKKREVETSLKRPTKNEENRKLS